MRGAFRILVPAAVVIASLLFLPVCAGAVAGPQFLVDANWLGLHGGKVVVVDVRKSSEYAKGHLPGAINIPVNSLQTSPDAIMFPVSREEKILGADGLDINRDVVLYGAGREMAYLEFWMLDYLGMRRIHVLNGGIEQWRGQLATGETKLSPAVFKARPDPARYATTAFVRGRLKKPGIILLDVRTPGEYAGTDVRSLRGGHIPGAININYAENFQKNTTVLKPASELKKIYAKLDRGQQIVTYCQTGTRAANTYFVLRELGFPRVRVYDASWIQWGSNPSLPADDVSYFNFVSVLKSIKKLQAEIKALKGQGK